MRSSFTILAVVVAAMLAGPAAAQSKWPSRTVTLVVGFPAGTNPDLVGRHIAKSLQERWEQSVIVSNKPGGSGMLAAEAVSRAAPDGSTLFLTSGGAVTVIPFLHEKMPYDALEDFQPVAMVAVTSIVLVASPSAPFKTLKELVAAAKAQPGTIDYGSYGMGSLHHISMEHLQHTAGIRLNHVPYGSTGPVQDVLAGRVPVMWSSMQIAPLIESGKLNALAYSGLTRTPRLPAVPTVAEQGFPGFETYTWFGIVGPAGMPPTVVKRVQTDLEAVVASSAFRERMSALGNEARFMGTDQLAKHIRTEHAQNKALLVGSSKK